MLVYDVNTQKTFENLDNWRDEFLIQVCMLPLPVHSTTQWEQ